MVNTCNLLANIDETNKTYFNIISKIFHFNNSISFSDIENLIIWSAIRKEVFFLPKKYKDAKLEFDKVIRFKNFINFLI